MYAVAVVTLVAAFGRNRTRAAEQALHLGVAALSFSPMLVYAAVFGLKDVFFTTLVVVMARRVPHAAASGRRGRARRARRICSPRRSGFWSIWLIAGDARLLRDPSVGSHGGDVCRMRHGRRPVAPARRSPRPRSCCRCSRWRSCFGAEGNYPRFVRNLIVGRRPEAVIERRAPIASGGLDELDRRREAIDSTAATRCSAAPRRRPAPASRRTETAGPISRRHGDGRHRDQPSRRRPPAPTVFPRRRPAPAVSRASPSGWAPSSSPAPFSGSWRASTSTSARRRG